MKEVINESKAELSSFIEQRKDATAIYQMPNDSIIQESIKDEPEDKTSKADPISDYEEEFN